MKTQFANKFGAARLRLISEVQHVRDIHGAQIYPGFMFDIETAEKLALITDNRGIQICPHQSTDGWRCYVIVHETASTAAIAEIESLTYTGDDPTRCIQAARN